METVDGRGPAAAPCPASPPRRLGVLAKEPRPGTVKTRLCPPLSPEEAAALYQVCLEETLARLSSGPFALTLFHAGAPDYFAARWPALAQQPQQGRDLGARLAQALAWLLQDGAGPALLLGSDSPDLPLELITQGFEQLAQGADAVVGPAADGGYVLIGMRRLVPELFRDIPWSTAAVLSTTRARAAALGIRLDELAAWDDVDDLASLARLVARSPASATARFARSRLAHHLAAGPGR